MFFVAWATLYVYLSLSLPILFQFLILIIVFIDLWFNHRFLCFFLYHFNFEKFSSVLFFWQDSKRIHFSLITFWTSEVHHQLSLDCNSHFVQSPRISFAAFVWHQTFIHTTLVSSTCNFLFLTLYHCSTIIFFHHLVVFLVFNKIILLLLFRINIFNTIS